MATPYDTGKVKIGLRYSPGMHDSKLTEEELLTQHILLSSAVHGAVRRHRLKMRIAQVVLAGLVLASLTFSLMLIVETFV